MYISFLSHKKVMTWQFYSNTFSQVSRMSRGMYLQVWVFVITWVAYASTYLLRKPLGVVSKMHRPLDQLCKIVIVPIMFISFSIFFLSTSFIYFGVRIWIDEEQKHVLNTKFLNTSCNGLLTLSKYRTSEKSGTVDFHVAEPAQTIVLYTGLYTMNEVFTSFIRFIPLETNIAQRSTP